MALRNGWSKRANPTLKTEINLRVLTTFGIADTLSWLIVLCAVVCLPVSDVLDAGRACFGKGWSVAMIRFSPEQDLLIESAAERAFRNRLRAAILLARGDFARGLQADYVPMTPEERGEERAQPAEPDLLAPSVLGREADGLDRFIDDTLNAADQMELFDEQTAAGFLALMLEYERVEGEAGTPEVYDFVKQALEREHSRASTRLAIIKDRLNAIASVNAVAPDLLDLMAQLEKAAAA